MRLGQPPTTLQQSRKNIEEGCKTSENFCTSEKTNRIIGNEPPNTGPRISLFLEREGVGTRLPRSKKVHKARDLVGKVLKVRRFFQPCGFAL